MPRSVCGSGADDDNSLMDGVHSDLVRLEAFIRSRDNLAIQVVQMHMPRPYSMVFAPLPTVQEMIDYLMRLWL